MKKYIIILLTVLVTTSCSLFFDDGTTSIDELSKLSGKEAYKVAEGDTLAIQVWGEPKLSREVFVRGDGFLTLPLVNDVLAKGKTLEQLSEDIRFSLSEYVPDATVTISVTSQAPTRYFLSGSFNKPGEYRSAERISFLQAVATGGGFTAFADDSSVLLIRNEINGEKRYKLNYSRVIEGKQPNPVLQTGDVIAVK